MRIPAPTVVNSGWVVMNWWGVEGGLLVKALDCGSKGPGFQSHLQQRFVSLPGALSPTPKLSRRFTFVSFGGDGDIKPSVLGNLSAIGSFLVSWVICSKPTYNIPKKNRDSG